MQPFCAPPVRSRRVSRRVSMPAIATVPSRRAGSRRATPCCGSSRPAAAGPCTTSPAAKTCRDSTSSGLDAVVADVRIRQRDDLPAVARVGEDFLVAGQRGVEHHLAGGVAGGADRCPWKTVPSASARRAWAWSGSSCGDKGRTPDRGEAAVRGLAERGPPSGAFVAAASADPGERAEAANCSRPGRGSRPTAAPATATAGSHGALQLRRKAPYSALEAACIRRSARALGGTRIRRDTLSLSYLFRSILRRSNGSNSATGR